MVGRSANETFIEYAAKGIHLLIVQCPAYTLLTVSCYAALG